MSPGADRSLEAVLSSQVPREFFPDHHTEWSCRPKATCQEKGVRHRLGDAHRSRFVVSSELGTNGHLFVSIATHQVHGSPPSLHGPFRLRAYGVHFRWWHPSSSVEC